MAASAFSCRKPFSHCALFPDVGLINLRSRLPNGKSDIQTEANGRRHERPGSLTEFLSVCVLFSFLYCLAMREDNSVYRVLRLIWGNFLPAAAATAAFFLLPSYLPNRVPLCARGIKSVTSILWMRTKKGREGRQLQLVI